MPGASQRQQATHERIGPEHRHLRPAAGRQPADHPHECRVYAVAVYDHER